jgi:hypothetical protein
MINPFSLGWGALPLQARAIIIGGVLLAATVAVLGFGWHCYNKGYASAEQKQKAELATALEMRDQAAAEKATFENNRNLAMSKKVQADRVKIAGLQAKLSGLLAARPAVPECDDPQEVTDALGAIIDNAREAMK